MVERKTIKIKKDTYDKIASRATETGFDSTDDYVEFVLKEVLNSLEDKEQPRQAYSKEDEKKVKERLRALGYLD